MTGVLGGLDAATWWLVWAQLVVLACAVLSVVVGDTLHRARRLQGAIADASGVVDRVADVAAELEDARERAGGPAARVFDDPRVVRAESDAARARYAAHRAGRRAARARRDRAVQERWLRDEL
ncbi:hypothetical protein CLV28_1757 [Sediminihabitans luteus]|uniref:Uncharacterized protein n=1 Tax=Sediminihabitans luteus TaxID=1138585 RepID=A0A2M9CQR2_9CELL|nr:hypothetical protein [Sediminihabitans luteus]PJJ74263.1 hypothetical protein CLV28_1757 [Sediminihabitans luteus]GII99116.1 hypothetical protein Slu03_14940 [Sediminihabitans luteus]